MLSEDLSLKLVTKADYPVVTLRGESRATESLRIAIYLIDKLYVL